MCKKLFDGLSKKDIIRRIFEFIFINIGVVILDLDSYGKKSHQDFHVAFFSWNLLFYNYTLRFGLACFTCKCFTKNAKK